MARGNHRDELDTAKARVYSVAPDDFTAERNRVVQELRSGGDSASAAEVQKLRRPSVAAWSVNRAARAEPQRVAELFAAGETLGRAQQDAASGRAGSTVRDAAHRRRVLIDRLTSSAMDFAGGISPNPETHRDAIDATWEAASIDPDVQRDVASGWLAKELPRPSGFGLVSDARSGPARATARTAEPEPRKTSRDELAVRRARAALDVAREELQAAQDAVRSADRDLRRAHDASENAARRVKDLEAALTAARTAARDAARDAKSAEQHAARARASHDRAERNVDKARRSLTDAEK